MEKIKIFQHTKYIQTIQIFPDLWFSLPLDKRTYLETKFICQEKQIKKTVSMKQFFWAPKTNIKVTTHTWAIFFPKNRLFSFFDIL